MALDHYVSQVHLKNFNSPELTNRMYATRKSDLKEFTPTSKDICRIENGSTNEYLKNDRAIEEFLKQIEPKYNISVEKLTNQHIDKECIYTIAGFIAYVASCSPAAMRIFSPPIKNIVERTAKQADLNGLIPKPPKELAGENLTELLESGQIYVDIDPKFPQSIGIKQVISTTSIYGNFKWDILLNNFSDSPFFTSDYPVAIENSYNSQILNKIVPLTPKVAVRIKPNNSFKKTKDDFNFSNFGFSVVKAKRKEISKINRLIVQCAEDLVLYSHKYPWVPKFIEKNRMFRIQNVKKEIEAPNGTYVLFQHKIQKA